MSELKRVGVFFFLFVYCVPVSFSITNESYLKMNKLFGDEGKERSFKFTCHPVDTECFNRQV
jgi:hypothetical protein